MNMPERPLSLFEKQHALTARQIGDVTIVNAGVHVPSIRIGQDRAEKMSGSDPVPQEISEQQHGE